MSEYSEGLWSCFGSNVYFPNVSGGFDLRGCPAPEANAHRIVACVNILANLPDEWITEFNATNKPGTLAILLEGMRVSSMASEIINFGNSESTGPTEIQVYRWYQEATIAHHIEEDGRHISKRAMFVAKKAWECGLSRLQDEHRSAESLLMDNNDRLRAENAELLAALKDALGELNSYALEILGDRGTQAQVENAAENGCQSDAAVNARRLIAKVEGTTDGAK